jgi:tRNA 2-selenouridine synthase SelU
MVEKARDIRIKKVFEDYTESKLKGEKASVRKSMEKFGYAKSSAALCQVTKTKEWQRLLDTIDDRPLLKQLNKIAMSSNKDSDKIAAIKELLKLKKLYPEQNKSPRNLFQTQINNLLAEDDKPIEAEVYEDKQVPEDN